jgi:hypothetical protein
MASLDSLPPDQRAVLQLVLQRGRSYDEIAQMLSIDRAAVRERALSAFDALGPQTRVAPESRALITDYLLGQLPSRVAEQTRDHLAESATERAWARVLASELSSLAKEPLPEIPVDASRRAPASAPEPEAAPETRAPAAVLAGSESPGKPPKDSGGRDRDSEAAPSSRRGGAILLGLGALVAIIVVVIVIATSGSSGNKPSHTATAIASTPATTPTTATTPSTTPTTGTSTTGAKVIGQVNLSSPTSAKGTTGVAQVVQQGSQVGVVIVAQGVPANTKHDAYAVWLYTSPTTSKFLGFVNPGVKADGKLQTAGVLPTNASSYKQLLVTDETQPKPAAPGKIVLQGALSIS